MYLFNFGLTVVYTFEKLKCRHVKEIMASIVCLNTATSSTFKKMNIHAEKRGTI